VVDRQVGAHGLDPTRVGPTVLRSGARTDRHARALIGHHGDEYVDDTGIEARSSLPAKCSQDVLDDGGVGAGAVLVGTNDVAVAGGDDAGDEGNVVARERVGVTAAVEVFAGGADEPGDLCEGGSRRDDALGDRWLAVEEGP